MYTEAGLSFDPASFLVNIQAMLRPLFRLVIPISLLCWLGCQSNVTSESYQAFSEQEINQAQQNGDLANEGYRRCVSFVQGWLAEADGETGLIPRNLDQDRDIWNAKDAAADNYPFMVLTAALTDRELFDGRMREMLETETRLTSRLGSMPDTYSFSKKTFNNDQVVLDDIIFGTSEYIKDGLLPLTEWLGKSPWSDRMLSMLDELWERAPIATAYGAIPSTNVEVNGEMLQILSRIFWMTGHQKYLTWATRLGDYYLLGDQHPTRDLAALRLRDHGCEIVSGLCELYATVADVDIQKKRAYQPFIHMMLDQILEKGRNDHGLFYNIVNPRTGEIINEGIADNFGYTLNGFYTVYQIDSVQSYRQATLKALAILKQHYRNFDWERGSADGYADAIEGALNLYNREESGEVASWMDSEMQVMWGKQQASGIIEGWHGDGNFARTTIMYNLWKSQGTYAIPWRPDIGLGAIQKDRALLLSITCSSEWEGGIHFDYPRHKEVLQLPFDWPRINQFPEWFVVDKAKTYRIENMQDQQVQLVTGAELIQGYQVTLPAGQHSFVITTVP